MSKKVRKNHTGEFRREAVRLVTEEGYKIAEAAQSLAINANMLGRWVRVATKIEQIAHGRVYTQEALRLLRGLKTSHAPLSNSRWLMRQLSPVIGILSCIVNCLWHKFSMRNTVAFQLVRHNRSRRSR